MQNNTCILYDGTTEVYQKLVAFCADKGFKVNESKESFYFLRAKKPSIFFWKALRMELEILLVEKEKVQVSLMLYKMGIRQPKSETEYMRAIEKLF